MSLKKAQNIANHIEAELGICIAAYQITELEFLKSKLEEFLDLDIPTEELEESELMSEFDDDFDGLEEDDLT